MIDASYLVEPVPGLWLLSIDANVFEPKDGDSDPAAEASYIDSSDAGWNAMLRHKPFVLDWMAEVARRARRLEKRLLPFSHYPALDTLGETHADEVALFGLDRSRPQGAGTGGRASRRPHRHRRPFQRPPARECHDLLARR